MRQHTDSDDDEEEERLCTFIVATHALKGSLYRYFKAYRRKVGHAADDGDLTLQVIADEIKDHQLRVMSSVLKTVVLDDYDGGDGTSVIITAMMLLVMATMLMDSVLNLFARVPSQYSVVSA